MEQTSTLGDLCEILQGASLSCVEQRLSAGQSSDVTDNDGRTPLMRCVQLGDIQRLDLLREYGADINTRDLNNCNCLHIAVKSGNEAMVTKLCGLGVDKNALDNEGCTPLLIALECIALDCARRLIAEGCDVNTGEVCTWCSAGQSVLHVAVLTPECHELIPLLLQAGSDVNKLDGGGRTPLGYSVYQRFLEVSQILLEHNADPNKSYPLTVATDMAYVEGAALLMSFGADPVGKSGLDSMAMSPFEFVSASIDEGSDYMKILEAMIAEDGFTTSTDDSINYMLKEHEITCYNSDGGKYRHTAIVFKLLAYGMQVTAFLKTCRCPYNSPSTLVCQKIRSLSIPVPLPLSVLCRNKVRLCLGKGVSQKAKHLGIPDILKLRLSAKVWDDRDW